MASRGSKPLVLITGATGHIGFRTLVTLVQLEKYRARISLRRESQIEDLKRNKALSPYLSSVESFIVVPDITAAGAFDKAVHGVDFILHIASPIPDASKPDSEINVKEDFLIPAIRGTESILESAAKTATVKRVVVTSSIVALAQQNGKSSVGPYDLAPVPDVDEAFQQNPWVAYRASKILSHDAGSKFMDQQKPSFDLVRVLPGYVQGRNDLVKESSKLASGSNIQMIQLVQGGQTDTPRTGNLVLVDDVADAHVKALDLNRAKSGDNFIAAGPDGKVLQWDDINGVVQNLFPGAVEAGITPLGGHQAVNGVDYDISNAVEQLDYNPSGLEQMVKSLVGQYIELVENERRAAP